ncbi:hypothetical protein ACHQM5_015831 [Ranunculus cassubicifolius]
MEAGKGIGLVAIVAVMLLFCGVAEADNPCYAECFKDCTTSSITCMFNPQCIATCGITCGLHDTCKHGSRKVLRNSAKVVASQSNSIEKNTVGVEAGNPCYAECVQDCLNKCMLSPFGCVACPGICGEHNTCKDVKNIEINSGKAEDVAQNHVGVEARNTLHLNSVADE